MTKPQPKRTVAIDAAELRALRKAARAAERFSDALDRQTLRGWPRGAFTESLNFRDAIDKLRAAKGGK